MISFIKNHPFAVEAFFNKSVVLTFAVDKQELNPLIPECLTLDILKEKWGFIAVAMVQTAGLRPKGFPRMMGNDFFLIGYRIFVRYTNEEGKTLRGLYILKSLTDSWTMRLLGNIFTHYNYRATGVIQRTTGNITEIKSPQPDFRIRIKDNADEVPIPRDSPFTDWKEARKFSGPLPFTFAYKRDTKEVLIIQGVRKEWKPRPVYVLNHQFSFLTALNLKETILASAFIVNNIPYYWKKGKTERWNR